MKSLFIAMLLFLNMCAQVTLGNIQLNSICSFSIDENIQNLSNTATVVIPHNYAALQGKDILEEFNVGDQMTIKAGYDDVLHLEFKGYIKEVAADFPLVITCEDESYKLRQNNLVESYRTTTLNEVLTDILPDNISFECPNMNLGRFIIDNESTYQVLKRIKEDYGLYSRLKDDVLHVNLRDLTPQFEAHSYVLNPAELPNMVKRNNLKYRRKEDYQLRVKVTSLQTNGKKTTVEVGSKDADASLMQITYPGNYSEDELQKYAEGIYNGRCYEGYSGTITGFGLPIVHAGDTLEIADRDKPEQEPKRYMVERAVITYNETSGYSRECTLSYKVS
ncbi:MAG: hypothetical protein ACK5L5_04145 [Bacteroidales bacterium]